MVIFVKPWLHRGTHSSGLGLRTVDSMTLATSSAVTGFMPRAAGTPAASSVCTMVGSTTLTSTPCGSSSARVASLKPTTANFDAE